MKISRVLFFLSLVLVFPAQALPDPEAVLAAVRDYHGGPGPWAVSGYRMGLLAMRELGLARHDFRLAVVHRSPDAVQYTCVLDGIHAATGASFGKRLVRLEPITDESATETCFRNRKTGRELRVRLRPDVLGEIRDVPYAEHEKTSRKLLARGDAELFTWENSRCF